KSRVAITLKVPHAPTCESSRTWRATSTGHPTNSVRNRSASTPPTCSVTGNSPTTPSIRWPDTRVLPASAGSASACVGAAMDGQPFVFVNKEVDPGLLATLRSDLVLWLETNAPVSDELQQRMRDNPRQHRFTLVFDREAYSPEFFAEMRRITFPSRNCRNRIASAAYSPSGSTSSTPSNSSRSEERRVGKEC